MRNWQSLFLVQGCSTYHVAIVPKYRKKAFYGTLRGGIEKMLCDLFCQQDVELVEGYAYPYALDDSIKV